MTADSPGDHGATGAVASAGGFGSGPIDVLVLYKIDRLIRLLADFAKMVEVFDAHGASHLLR